MTHTLITGDGEQKIYFLHVLQLNFGSFVLCIIRVTKLLCVNVPGKQRPSVMNESEMFLDPALQ